MATEWYYAVGGSERGPVSSSELKRLAASGTIQPETLIWKDGYSAWVHASTAQGLFPSDVPPIPPRSLPPPVRDGEAGAAFDIRIVLALAAVIVVAWGALYTMLGTLGGATWVLVGMIAIVSLLVVTHLMLCKSRAIAGKKKEQSVFFNMIKLVLWAPNEGFILLRNKKIKDIIHGEGGGIRFIFPMFGEEIATRVPLGVQLTYFEDDHFLTRELVEVRIRAGLWWHVVDIEKYYFLITTGVHVVTEGEGRVRRGREVYDRSDTAEAWIQALAESSLRKLVAQANYAALVSATASHQLDSADSGGNSESPQSVTPEFISEQLRRDLLPKVLEYGLDLNRVEIQDVTLDPKLQEAITKVWTSSLRPAQSEAEAKAKRIELEAIAGVLGVEAAAMNEVAKNFQHANYVGGVPAMLGSMAKGETKPPPKNKNLPKKPDVD